jgi:hypothetical protein
MRLPPFVDIGHVAHVKCAVRHTAQITDRGLALAQQRPETADY